MKKLGLLFLIIFTLYCATLVPAMAEDYTFTDRDGNTRTVPDGEYSFATRVVVLSLVIPGHRKKMHKIRRIPWGCLTGKETGMITL